jgi:hypothetical protein
MADDDNNDGMDESAKLRAQIEEINRKAAEASASGAPPKSDGKKDNVYDLFGGKRPSKDDVEEFVVDVFNKRYCCITLKGKYMVYDKDMWEFSTTKSFIEKWKHLTIPTFTMTPDGSSKSKIEERAIVYLRHPKREMYDGVVFDPSNNHHKRFWNTWRGFQVEPKEGDCPLTLQYLKEVISNNDEKVYNWILDFLAHMVQKPWEKPEIALVLLGPKGIGKSFLAKHIIRRIVDGNAKPRHYFKTANPDHVFGAFTSQLDSIIALFLEEVTWGGDKRHEGRMKELITGDTHDVNEKNIPVYTISNRMRIFMSSNNDWVVPASKDERRYMITYVSSAHQGDKPWFAAIENELDNGGDSKLMYLLMNRNIDEFDYRGALNTKALIDQKLESLHDVEKWWYSVLYKGQIKLIESETNNGWICVGRKILYSAYCKYMKEINSRSKILSDREFGIRINEYMPRIINDEIQYNEDGRRVISIVGEKRIGKDGDRQYCYVIPPLSMARELWEFRIKGKLDWLEADEWELPEHGEM